MEWTVGGGDDDERVLPLQEEEEARKLWPSTLSLPAAAGRERERERGLREEWIGIHQQYYSLVRNELEELFYSLLPRYFFFCVYMANPNLFGERRKCFCDREGKLYVIRGGGGGGGGPSRKREEKACFKCFSPPYMLWKSSQRKSGNEIVRTSKPPGHARTLFFNFFS